MSADQRVTYAREFLAGAPMRKVSELPPSVLAREQRPAAAAFAQVRQHHSNARYIARRLSSGSLTGGLQRHAGRRRDRPW
jgi:hypothetical protein